MVFLQPRGLEPLLPRLLLIRRHPGLRLLQVYLKERVQVCTDTAKISEEILLKRVSTSNVPRQFPRFTIDIVVLPSTHWMPKSIFFFACLTTPLLFHDMLNRIRALELFWELHSSHSYNVCFYCVGTANIPHGIQTIYVRLT